MGGKGRLGEVGRLGGVRRSGEVGRLRYSPHLTSIPNSSQTSTRTRCTNTTLLTLRA